MGSSSVVDNNSSSETNFQFSNLRLFWFFFWLCVSEFLYLILLIVNYTAITSLVGETSGPFVILYFFPPCVVLVGIIYLFISLKSDYTAKKIVLFILWISIVVGIAGFILAMVRYVDTFSSKGECVWYKGKTRALTRTLYVVLTAAPIAFRIGSSYLLFSEISKKHSPSSAENESSVSFKMEPNTKMWKPFIRIMDGLFLVFCTPLFCICKSDDSKDRQFNKHMVQLLVESVALILACVTKIEIELIAIVPAFLGCCLGLGRLFFVDVIMNSFSLCMGVFLAAVHITRFSCPDGDSTGLLAARLVIFSVVCPCLRFQSVIHSFVEAHVQIHRWTVAQIETTNMNGTSDTKNNATNGNNNDYTQMEVFSVANFSYPRFFQIPNFSTLLKYPGVHVEPIEEKVIVDEATARDQKLGLKVSLVVVLGLFLVLGFSITMGSLLPQYKGGNRIDEILSWNSTNCTINSVGYIPIPKTLEYNFYYLVEVEGSDDMVIASTLKSRFTSSKEPKLDYQSSHPCRIDPKPYYGNYDSIVQSVLDYKHKSENWKHVSIIASDKELKSYKSKYLLWTILPFIFIVIGTILMSSFFLLCTCIRKRLNI